MQPIPDAISHRQLCAWLKDAAPEPQAAAAAVQPDTPAELDAVLDAYGQLGGRLLQLLQGHQEEELSSGRTPRQLMALGALRVHAQLALQALAASRS
jgi:hypothetical protein